MFFADCLADFCSFCVRNSDFGPPPGSFAMGTLQTSEEAPWTPMIPTTYEEASDGACIFCRALRSAKTTQAALSSHPGRNASTLMVKIRKITTSTDTATAIDSAQTPYPYPNATIETEEARPIMDGSEMASRITGRNRLSTESMTGR